MNNSGIVMPCAIKGGEFLLERVKVKGEQRCYFAVSEAGLPVRVQRKPYTECFFIVGLIELFRATGNQKYQVRNSGLANCSGVSAGAIDLLCSLCTPEVMFLLLNDSLSLSC